MITSLEGKKKKLLFQLLFSTYLPKFLLKFQAVVLVGCNLIPYPMSTHVAYIWWTLLHEKWEIHKKTWFQRFSCISQFSCSRVHRNYATWVLLGWVIKFCIQRVLPLEIWVKNLGDKLKIRVEKVVFSFFPLKFDDVIKSYFIISTIIL